jgi:hypothetical protein
MYYTLIRDDTDEGSTPVGATLQIFRSRHFIACSSLSIITSVHLIGKCFKLISQTICCVHFVPTFVPYLGESAFIEMLEKFYLQFVTVEIMVY